MMAKWCHHIAVHGTLELAAKWSKRERHKDRAGLAARSHLGQRGLQLPSSKLELARQLRREVTSVVNRLHEVGLRGDRAVEASGGCGASLPATP